jgi:hypothetical protein
VLTGVSVIAPVLLAVMPVIEPTTVEVHVITGLPKLVVGVKFSAVPLQIEVVKLEALFVITGTGLTLTVTDVVLPLQPLAVGVII